MRWGRWQRQPGGRPLVLGHRGARAEAPENTLAAFELAARQGADGVELDVRLDRVERVIVLHDATLERVTGSRDFRAAESLDPKELEGVDVGGGERIPLLSDVMAWAQQRRMLVNVELKHDVSEPGILIQRVATVVRANPSLRGELLLSCFDPLMVWRLARLLPEVPVGWLIHRGQWMLRHAPWWTVPGAAAIHLQAPLAQERKIGGLRKVGLLCNVWTVNSEEDARRLSGFGVDALISDQPGRIVKALAQAEDGISS
jgi:glycerophosphoryl diester phosphodiesterase